VDRAYRDYKETMGLYDYTDILDKFVKEGIAYCPRFQLTFMDEAQDLSPMQWDIAHALDDISDKMYCAGDDDQAIYRWAGADVDHFINLPGGAEILEQSYRIPASVHVVAERIVSRIERRYKKVYKPRTEKGCVDRIYSVGELDMTKGGWLVMAQANYMLTPVAEELKRAGLLFERNGRRSISERISLAVNGWESLRKEPQHRLHDSASHLRLHVRQRQARVPRIQEVLRPRQGQALRHAHPATAVRAGGRSQHAVV
jgi:hypothetical protein